MTINDFSIELDKKLKTRLGDDYNIVFADTLKNNGVLLHGVSIRKQNQTVAPTIYLEPFYTQYTGGESLESITDMILNIYRENDTSLQFEGDYFTDFNNIKDRICFKLCNTEKNSCILNEMPSVPFHDLSIVFYIFISDETIGSGQVLIKNDLFSKWNIDVSEMMDYAMTNTPNLLGHRFSNIVSVLEEMAKNKGMGSDGVPMPDFEMLKGNGPSLYVLSNNESFNGASCMLYSGELEKLSKEINDNYFIIPSSVHELIIVPESMEIEGNGSFNNKCSTLLDMIHNVNLTEVPESDFLSDNLYYYDREQKNVSLIASSLFIA